MQLLPNADAEALSLFGELEAMVWEKFSSTE